MEAATVPSPPADPPKADPPKATRPKPDDAKKRASGRDEKAYLVFELDAPEWTPETNIKFVAEVNATSSKDARWAGVDTDPRLQAAVKVKEGERGGVYMAAIATRNATVELTREEIVESSVRK